MLSFHPKSSIVDMIRTIESDDERMFYALTHEMDVVANRLKKLGGWITDSKIDSFPQSYRRTQTMELTPIKFLNFSTIVYENLTSANKLVVSRSCWHFRIAARLRVLMVSGLQFMPGISTLQAWEYAIDETLSKVER